MPEVPTHEELESLAKENETLREKIAAAESLRATRDDERARELRGAQLYAENTRLEAELAAATKSAQVGVTRDAASGPLAAAVADIKAAEAIAAAPPIAVDTNVDNPPSDTGETKATKASTEDASKNGGNA